MSTPVSRRRFIQVAVVSAAALPFSMRSGPAFASDLPKVDLDEPLAKALKYVHDASGHTPEANPPFKPGSDCTNCRFWTAAEDVEWGPCTLFPGKLVAGPGWCVSWAPKV